jgi:hypothetical protein
VVAGEVVVRCNVGANRRSVGRRLRRYRSRGGTMAQEPHPPPRSSALFHRGVRRVVPRRARPNVVPLATDVSTGPNGIGVKVWKGPRRPAARVPGRQQRAWREPVPAQSIATDGARRGW